MTEATHTPETADAGQKPAAGTRKSSAKPARSRSREFALQALYQHIVGKNEASDIDVFTRDLSGFHKADSAHYDALLYGCVEQSQALDALIAPKLDRSFAEISPIERAIMWIGVYEMQHCLDVPWRVVLKAMILLPSSVARALASSMIVKARRSASAKRMAVSLREVANSASTRWLAAASSDLALSAAARPSAIF